MSICREDLKEIKDDILSFMGVRCDAIDARLDKVNGRLDKQADQLTEHHGQIARMEQRATNLDREVFKRRHEHKATLPTPESDGVAITISESLLKKVATPRFIGYVLAGIWMAVETIQHMREWIAPLLAKQ
jgi:hypothetical protein